MSSAKPSFKHLQDAFRRAVTDRDETSAREFSRWLDTPPAGPTPMERIKIYRDAWFIRLEESLREDYPHLSARLGENKWAALIENYVRAHPSSSFTLMRTGNSLPHYLRELGASDWQVELAQYENALCLSLTAADPKPWDVGELSQLSESDAETLRLELQPTTILLDFRWNVDELDEASVQPKAVVENGHKILIYREGFSPSVERLDPREFAFLKALESRPTLGQLADQFPDGEWVPWLAQRARSGVLRPIDR